MKIRSGFVSNSSSSSFVLIVDKELWNSEVVKLNEDQKKTIEIYTGGGKEDFNSFFVFNWMTGNNGDYIYDELNNAFSNADEDETVHVNSDDNDDKVEEMIQWFDEFIGKLAKQKDKVKTIEIDC